MTKLIPTQSDNAFSITIVISPTGECKPGPFHGEPGYKAIDVTYDLSKARDLNPAQIRGSQGSVMEVATEIACCVLNDSRPSPPTLHKPPFKKLSAPPDVTQQGMANAIRAFVCINGNLDEGAYEALARLTDEALLVGIISDTIVTHPWRFIEAAIKRLYTPSVLRGLRSYVTETSEKREEYARVGPGPYQDLVNCEKALALIDQLLANEASDPEWLVALIQTAKSDRDRMSSQTHAALDKFALEVDLVKIAKAALSDDCSWTFVQAVIVRIEGAESIRELLSFIDAREKATCDRCRLSTLGYLYTDEANILLARHVLSRRLKSAALDEERAKK